MIRNILRLLLGPLKRENPLFLLQTAAGDGILQNNPIKVSAMPINNIEIIAQNNYKFSDIVISGFRAILNGVLIVPWDNIFLRFL